MACIGAWCGDKLSFALGTYVGIGRVGSIVCNILVPHIFARTQSTSYSFWIGFGVSLAILACSFLLVLVESLSPLTSAKTEHQHASNVVSVPGTFWLLAVLCGLLYASRNSFGYSPWLCISRKSKAQAITSQADWFRPDLASTVSLPEWLSYCS